MDGLDFPLTTWLAHTESWVFSAVSKTRVGGRKIREREREVGGRRDIEEKALLADEYSVWKKNTPFLYDLVISHALEWPSLTIQWLPFSSVHRFILGTHTSDGVPNFLMIADVDMPASSTTYAQPPSNPKVHEDVVKDVLWHLMNENLFGSVGDDKRLMTWDLCSSMSNSPQHSIVAHEKEVEWSPKNETVLASSAADRRLIVWDLNRIGDEQTAEDAEDGPPELLFVHGGHTAKISEFSWNRNEPWLISSVAEDNILQVWPMAESIYRDDLDVGTEGS